MSRRGLDLTQQREMTTAGGLLSHVRMPVILGMMLAGPGTSAAATATGHLVVPFAQRRDQTTAGAPFHETKAQSAALAELRRLSGLTWDQLARLFAVSRRSLHFWASGKPMTPGNEEHLHRVLGVLRRIDRGSAAANRRLLFTAGEGRLLPFDLLVERGYERVVALVGEGEPRQVTRAPRPSAEARAARAPLPPDVLADATQDANHRDLSGGRPAKSVRFRGGG